ncbi:hypothetical protein QBC35DRAFT_444679 [Podospora australis]|uniref:VOC domain-containing protein n=1 Tax=Podospora australis TaxID=1536484 RepID=A0AAN6WM91_9PEZI|nr:hypothetical protein QBC35DRAFT_444679 [Podospora australis]
MAGYFFNHAALNVRNLTRSIAWYRDVLGLQVLFTFRASPRYSVVYLGHSNSTTHSKGKFTYQTAAQLTEAMMSGRARGLLELNHHTQQGEKGLNRRTSTQRFSHLGLIVPNVSLAQERLDIHGYGGVILKRAGELPDLEGPAGKAYGLLGEVFENDPAEAELVSQALLGALLVLDPDGNLIEVQSLQGET